jgi:hypothetical protein
LEFKLGVISEDSLPGSTFLVFAALGSESGSGDGQLLFKRLFVLPRQVDEGCGIGINVAVEHIFDSRWCLLVIRAGVQVDVEGIGEATRGSAIASIAPGHGLLDEGLGSFGSNVREGGGQWFHVFLRGSGRIDDGDEDVRGVETRVVQGVTDVDLAGVADAAAGTHGAGEAEVLARGSPRWRAYSDDVGSTGVVEVVARLRKAGPRPYGLQGTKQVGGAVVGCHEPHRVSAHALFVLMSFDEVSRELFPLGEGGEADVW